MQRRNTGPYQERALASRQQASRGGVGDEAYLPRRGPKKRHAFPMSQVKPDIASTACSTSLDVQYGVRMRYCTLKVCFLYTSRKFQKMGFQLLSTPLHSVHSTQPTPLSPLHSLHSTHSTPPTQLTPLHSLHSTHSTHSAPLSPLHSLRSTPNQMFPFDLDFQDERRFCCPPGRTPTPWTRSEPAQSPPHMTRLRSGVTALSSEK
jgi:hypothetical protein